MITFSKSAIASSLTALAILSATTPAGAALNAYLTLRGSKQGDIKGSVTQKGREGKILVFSASHMIVSPRDLASGKPAGKRQHKPFVIFKELDASSPRLWNALVTNEVMAKFELQFWAPNSKVGGVGGTSTEMIIYSVVLTNASVQSIDFRMPNNKLPDQSKLPEYEEVSFSYEGIQWTWTQGGITARDSWMAR